MDDTQIFEACARAAHEANRAYCIAQGDESQLAWEDAPDWQTSSCIKGVKGVLLDGNGPEQSHESWLKEKADTGWKYGPTKDPEKKEHPCFVPYNELPLAQREKDDIFVSTVRAVARALKFAPLPESPSVEDRLSALEAQVRHSALAIADDRRARKKTMNFTTLRDVAFPGVSDAEASPETLLDLLSMVCEEKLPLEAIERWTPAEREAAEKWAAAQHAIASDNEIDEIPAEPVHVRKLREMSPKQDWVAQVSLTPRGTSPE